MASPFYLFRKYQKTFLVIAGVLAMFIFVLADPLMSWIQSSGGGPSSGGSGKTVLASWEGGSLNARQLSSLSQRRYKISNFLRNLYGMAQALIEQEGGTATPPKLPNFILAPNTAFRDIQVSCLTTRVLAQQAKKSGISISDDVVNNYLREWGLRRMGDAEIGALLKRLNLRDKELFAGIREMLISDYYFGSYSLATRGITPEQRWQDWKRINERIAVEAAILPQEKFLAEVPEPSDAQLQNFYEQHKNREAETVEMVINTQLPSPNPGFREPRRVKLQYLVGNVEDWTQKMLDKISDEEIADYYERNKRAMFVKREIRSSTSAAGLFDEGEEEASETETEKVDKKPATAETTAEDSSDPPEESTTEKPTTATEPDADESSRALRSSPFRLTAFQTEASATDESATKATAAGEKADAEKETQEKEAEKQEEQSAEETTQQPAKEKAEEPTNETKAEEPTGETNEQSAAAEKPVEYEPLENVSNQIRRSLAKDKAVVALQKVVDQTFTQLQSTYNPYGFEVVSARSEQRDIPEPPAALADFAAIARETGLASEETVPLSFKGLVETFVGKALDAQSRQEFVVQRMFGDQEPYEPYRAVDLDGNWYLVSKVADIASHVPEFDEVRDAVLAAWKAQEAAKLALARAKELAEQAKASGKSVAEIAKESGYESVTTDMFSWLNFGTTPADMQRGPRLGDAPPLEAVDAKFMTEVFKLKAEDRISLLNHDQTIAYLLQLSNREQTAEEMRKQFLAEANNWFGGQIMTQTRIQRANQKLINQLREKAGLNDDKLQEYLAKESE